MKRLIEESKKYIFNTYSRLPVIIVKGEGFKLWDNKGKEYIDFMGSRGTANLGHCHPEIVNAVKEQAERLIHVTNDFYIEPQILLAKMLVDNSFADKVFFANSGAEAVESAIKLARKYSRDRFGPNRYEIITMYNSFHGRTMGAISATAQEKFHKGFEPMLDGFKYIPFNDIDALKESISNRTCAVMIQPIQGEGGVNCPKDNYLNMVREICNDKDILLIFDEVQVGCGRTGKLFAYENYGIEPDIMTLAKSLAGGLPIGAMLSKDEIADSFSPGTHASTFGGNPLSTAAGIASLSILLKGEILENCRRVGKYFIERLNSLKDRYKFIKDIRGIGLIIGMELDFNASYIVDKCLERGLIINCTMGNILRFLPPLIIREKEVDLLTDTLDDIFKERV